MFFRPGQWSVVEPNRGEAGKSFSRIRRAIQVQGCRNHSLKSLGVEKEGKIKNSFAINLKYDAKAVLGDLSSMGDRVAVAKRGRQLEEPPALIRGLVYDKKFFRVKSKF